MNHIFSYNPLSLHPQKAECLLLFIDLWGRPVLTVSVDIVLACRVLSKHT